MVEGQAELLGDWHNTENRQKNKTQERMRALMVYSCISLCLPVHNHLLPIYREWIVQLEWELACVLIWAWENKLPAVLECGRVGIFSIMACPEALNHTWRYLVGLHEVQGWTKGTLGWCTLGVRPYGTGFHKHARPTTETLWHLKKEKKAKWRKPLAVWLNQKAQKHFTREQWFHGHVILWHPPHQLSSPPRI